MGWVTMIISGSLYYMIPRISRTELYSIKLANLHFWLVLIGQLVYTVSMWIGGIQQGAMWKATNPDGSLAYSFLEGVVALYPYWMIRLAGGLIFFVGIGVFAYNLIKTVRQPKGTAMEAEPLAT
jgi:cytochrome c oxidase cbb3-type subunit 1